MYIIFHEGALSQQMVTKWGIRTAVEEFEPATFTFEFCDLIRLANVCQVDGYLQNVYIELWIANCAPQIIPGSVNVYM